MIQNHPSQCHLGVRLDLCTFQIVVPTPNSWDDKCPCMTRSARFCLLSLLNRSRLSCFWLSPVFSSILLSFSTAAFAAGIFIASGIGINFCTNFVVTQWIHAFSWDEVFMVLVLRPFHAYPHRFVGLNSTSIFRLVLSNCATSSPVLMKLKSTRHRWWHRNFQLSTGIIHDTLEFPHHQVQWNKFLVIVSSASTIQAYFVLCSPTAQQVSLYGQRWSLQGIAAGIGISNFLRAFFIMRFNYSSSGSIKKIPRQLPAHGFVGIDNAGKFSLVFPNNAAGFTAAIYWCFTRHCCCIGISTFYERFSWCVYILDHLVQRRRYHVIAWHQLPLAIQCPALRSLVSLSIPPWTMYIHQVASHSTKWISWNLSMHSTLLFLRQRSSNLQYVSPTSHPKSCR